MDAIKELKKILKRNLTRWEMRQLKKSKHAAKRFKALLKAEELAKR